MAMLLHRMGRVLVAACVSVVVLGQDPPACIEPTCAAESAIIANCNDFVGGDLTPEEGGAPGTSFEGATCKADGSIQWSGCDTAYTHKVTLVVTDIQGTVAEPRVVDDGSFMFLARQGAVQACSETTDCCLEMDAPNNGYDTTYECELEYAAADSNLAIGVGFLHATATFNAAACNPDKSFALVDDVHPGGLPNLETLTFMDDEGGYLAGVVAGQLAEAMGYKVGVISGLPVLPVARFVTGFINGVSKYCPSCAPVEVRTCFSFGNEANGGYAPGEAPMWMDEARGYGCGIDAAMDLLDNDVSVIFGAGGGTGSAGAIYAAKPVGWSGAIFDGPTLPTKTTPQAYVIGVDTDEYTTNYVGTDVSDRIITSAIKNVATAVALAIGNYFVGLSSGANFYLSVSNGGMGYAECHEACASSGGPITAAMIAVADAEEDALRGDGSITGVDKFNAVCVDGVAGMCAGDCTGTLPWGAPFDYTCPDSGSSSSSKKKKNDDTGLAIGVGIAGAVLFLICAGFVCLLVCKEKRGEPLFEKVVKDGQGDTEMT